jgi:hypothetical protein
MRMRSALRVADAHHEIATSWYASNVKYAGG